MSENSNIVATSNFNTPSCSVASQVPPLNVSGDESENSSLIGRKRRQAQPTSTKIGNQGKKLGDWKFDAENSQIIYCKNDCQA